MPDPKAPASADMPALLAPPRVICGSARPVGARRPWAGRIARWLRSATDALGAEGRPDRAIDAFADVLARARDLGEVRTALVELAGRVSGAGRVDLLRARGGRSACPLASWPGRGGDAAKPRRGSPDPAPLRIELRSAGEVLACLQVAIPGRPVPPRAVRALETLCAMAACAERGLGAAGQAAGAGAGAEAEDGVIRGEPGLDALLRFTLAQSRRRHESVALMAIAVDRHAAIRSLLGEAHAEEAVARVVRTVREALRASDVVAQLDGGRLMAILPNAPVDDAARVAESIRAAIARSGAATAEMPRLTATIGVAAYPDHADAPASLRAAACSALASAAALGCDRVASLAPLMAVAS